ncbi:MAG: SPFH domain-containing protein [Promethearchaeota archaeon]|nr:MAG: SPFH domain-containing protein [Candidatus Lokiarchaeota archaeon]
MVNDIKINIFNLYFKEIKDKKFKDEDPEIISWQREDRGTLGTPLLYIFPKPGDSIKDKKYFAVKDYEKALFYNQGGLIGVIGGGVYELDKKAKIKGTEIVWVDTSIIEIPWGIPKKNGIPTKDGATIGLFGDLKLRINDVKIFYNDIVAGKKEWVSQDLKNWIISLLHTSLRDIFKNYKVKQVILEDRERVINLITSKITEELIKYGLELETFNIIGMKSPEDLQEVLDEEKEKTKTISQLSRGNLEELVYQKEELQIRIKELKDKRNELQDKLLNDEITSEEFGKKKRQIEIFLEEAESEIKEIEKSISNK